MSESSSPNPATHEGDCHGEWRKTAPEAGRLEVSQVRERLAGARGPAYWRSLEELAETPAFDEMLHREFPRLASEWPSGVSRRNFLQLAGASLGLAGLTACTRQPIEKLVPYVKLPEQLLPGKPLLFATSMPLAGYATGLLVESHEGRPTKIEGNPDHPASLGSTDAVTQASVLGLYDPDRSQNLTRRGQAAPFADLQQQIAAALNAQSALGGVGLRLLTGPVTSPTEARLITELLAAYPQAKWHRWDPLSGDHQRRGLADVFGAPTEARFDLAKAEVVVAFESDLLAAGPGAVRYARDFAARRKVDAASTSMNRLYVAESSPTVTGSVADHRLRARPSELPALLLALATRLGVSGLGGGATAPLQAESARWIDALARDLAAHRGTSVVVAGEALPAPAHALVAAINETLGNGGATVLYSEPIESDPVEHLESLAALVQDLRAGSVDLLVVSGANPVYDAPADLDFAGALAASGAIKIHHGLYADETAAGCDWHLPAAHYLESWGDARAYDGTVSLLQPLIEPLYGGKTLAELLSLLVGRPSETGYDSLRATWEGPLGGEAFEDAFRKLLHDGLVPGSARAAASVAVQAAAIAGAAQALAALPPAAAEGLELALRPDASVLDGRFANNGWLQELPKPITKLTWDNAVMLSPRTAESLHVASRDVVELTTADGRKLSGPAWILPGQADGVATVHLGYGRRRAGRVADGIGFDGYAAQTRAARWGAPGASLRKTGDTLLLACAQGHHAIEWIREETEQAAARGVVREATFEEFLKEPHFAHSGHAVDPDLSLNPGYEYKNYAWGMVIDLNACTGCNACVIACQSENNIPVVGKEQVDRGREMQWLRIDRYFRGDLDAPEGIASQPVPCMQCEQAPCELVCPVAATTHNEDGLNDMVYNRCVGTRYCANNCPYKVRRFNFLLFQDWETPQLQLQRNPDVTVRSRGVMEKCTYCVQRINRARIPADRDGRRVQDGEIVTACQQACPSQAISFGDLNDAAARVTAQKKNPRNYALLEELGTRPRTTYLAMVKNPNPELA